MAKYFRVTLRQDAWLYHEALLSSEQHSVTTKTEAANAVIDYWKGKRNDFSLIETDANGFDDAECNAGDVEEISKEQYEEAVGAHEPTASPTLTLDEAKGQFEATPSGTTAAAYLRELVTYNADDMISDDTLYSGIANVRAWLEQQG